MDALGCCSQIIATSVFYKLLIKSCGCYEVVFEDNLTELEIIENVIGIPNDYCSIDEIIIRLKYLYASIDISNCMQARSKLLQIVDTLVYLWQSSFFNEVSSTVLELIEIIMLTNEMAIGWNPLLVGKLLKIPICGFQFNDSPQAFMVANFLSRIADVLPIEKTIDVLCGYLVTDYAILLGWNRLRWSLKLLCYVAMQRGAEVTPEQVKKVRKTLIALTRDNCESVSTDSVFSLVALYENTDICGDKDTMQQELQQLLPQCDYIFKEFYEAMLSNYYAEPEPETSIVELTEYNVRSESEIIEIACNIEPTTPTEERNQALMDFCECIANGNCEMPNKSFRKIYLMLMKLLHCVPTAVEFTLVLDVIEKIFRCKPMKPYWTVFFRKILLKIILIYNVDNDEFIDAIDTFIRNSAGTFPITETIKIVNPLINAADYAHALCSMKILCEVAGQHKRFSKANLTQLLTKVVYIIDAPQKNFRLLAECMLFKLCNKLSKKRVISVIVGIVLNRILHFPFKFDKLQDIFNHFEPYGTNMQSKCIPDND